MPRVYTSKYGDFLESEAVSRRGKLPPHELTNYVDITCPHCHHICAELPITLLKTQKSNSCLKHLRVCPEFKGTVAPAPEKKEKEREPTNADLLAQLKLMREENLKMSEENRGMTRRMATSSAIQKRRYARSILQCN